VLKEKEKIIIVFVVVIALLLILGSMLFLLILFIDETNVIEEEIRLEDYNYESYLNAVDFNSFELRKKGMDIADKCDGYKECQVAKLYNFISQEIEYYSDPRTDEYIQTPEQTLELKGGDCEDLSILLFSLLENIGVKSYLGFTYDHVFVVTCDLDLESLYYENLEANAKWNLLRDFKEKITLEANQTRCFGCNELADENELYVGFDVYSANLMDVFVLPTKEDVIKYKEDKTINYGCYMNETLSSASECYLKKGGGLIITNNNDFSIEVNVNATFFIKDYGDLNIASDFLHLNEHICVFLDPTLGEQGFAGDSGIAINEDFILIDPITWDYFPYYE
jgi:hypothetical protein